MGNISLSVSKVSEPVQGSGGGGIKHWLKPCRQKKSNTAVSTVVGRIIVVGFTEWLGFITRLKVSAQTIYTIHGFS